MIAALIGLFVGVFSGWLIFSYQNRNDQTTLAWYRATYLTLQGSTVHGSTTISYCLQSFDGGQTWYATEPTAEGRVKILGDAETVYPGLLAGITGLNALVRHVEEHGPLTLTGDQIAVEVPLLEKAGFTITHHPQNTAATTRESMTESK